MDEIEERKFEVDMIDETISNLESFKGHLIETGRGCVGCWKKLSLDLEVLHAMLHKYAPTEEELAAVQAYLEKAHSNTALVA